MLLRFYLALAIVLSVGGFVFAQELPRRGPETKPSEGKQAGKDEKQPGTDRLSVTEHEITVAGKILKYRATVGTIAMKDEAGKHKCDLFFVAYEKLPAAEDPATRPITYVFNGGPGAAAVWLHLGTAGPKRVKFAENGEALPPPSTLVDNEQTWLAATDLVFIDPVNTGYSRPAPGEDAKQFYGVENDLKWVGEFVRLYTTRYQRWASPKFLAGESYGTTRASALAGYLLEDTGIALNGIVLISSVLDFATIGPRENNDLPYALWLPSYTAVAGYHNKLPKELKYDVPGAVRQAEKWVREQYIGALAQGDSLGRTKREEIAAALVKYTGLSADIVDKANLRISPFTFEAALLENERKVVGRFDGRLTGYDPRPLDRQPAFDPSLDAYRGAYGGTFNAYVRRELKFESDLNYQVLNGLEEWNFGPPGGGPLYVADRLRACMSAEPRMKVMFAEGYHDLATPWLATRYTIEHMNLSPELRANISEHQYDGGHMMYHRLESLKKLNADVKEFIQSASTTR
jgi:carboxypeptidase C (cathepsin A)